MIHLKDGRFSLRYELSSDRGSLFFDRDLLIANWNGSGWEVIHGPGWFELEHYHRGRSGNQFEGRDLRARLRRVRALSRQTTDFFSTTYRTMELQCLQVWDKWWREDRARFLASQEVAA